MSLGALEAGIRPVAGGGVRVIVKMPGRQGDGASEGRPELPIEQGNCDKGRSAVMPAPCYLLHDQHLGTHTLAFVSKITFLTRLYQLTSTPAPLV